MKKERIVEMLIVCIVSGMGMIYSGHIIDRWRMKGFLKEDDRLWVMITPLLGLKGNLEMTLASRLATMAKLGYLRNPISVGKRNLIIIQIQGIILGFGTSVVVGIFNVLSTVDGGIVLFNQFIRFLFIGVLTASTACLILGTVTIVIVYCSWSLNFDPDNIASPLAAALGDTVTLFIFYFYANLCPSGESTNFRHYLALTFIFIILFLLLSFEVSSKEENSTLRTCWISIFPAMILSSISGLIFKSYVFKIQFLATLQPLVNGVGGNVASILCSSMSTNCHKLKKEDKIKEELDLGELCRFLILIAIVTHFFLLSLGSMLGLVAVPGFIKFILLYFSVVFLQAIVLLYFVQFIVIFLWKSGIDPDNSSIPLTTGFGDIIGTSFLCIGLSILV